MSDESITHKEDNENLLYIARKIHLEELAFGDDHGCLLQSSSSESSVDSDYERVGVADARLAFGYARNLGPHVFKDSEVIAKTQPFELKWSFGINSKVKIINLTDQKKRMLFFASSHFPILYDYCKKQIIHLDGHSSLVKSLSADFQGKYLLSSESSPNGCLIIWDLTEESPVPIRTFYDVYPYNGAFAVRMCGSARFMITVGQKNSQEYSIDLWLWTLGKDEPDYTENVSRDYGRPVTVRCNREFEEHVMIIFEKNVIFLEVDVDARKFINVAVPQITYINRIGHMNGGTYVQGSHECYACSNKGYIVNFGNTLYPQSYEESKLNNQKVFRNAVKVSPVSVNGLNYIQNLLVVGDARGCIYFFDKKIRLLYWITNHNLGAIRSISFNKTSKFIYQSDKRFIMPKIDDDRVFNCGLVDMVEDIEVLLKKDLPVDVSLDRNPIVTPDFFVATKDCNIYGIDMVKNKCTSLFFVADDYVSAIETHREENFLVIGFANGRLLLIDFEKNTVINSVILPKLKDNDMNTITCLKYSAESFHLVCGRMNGEIWILDPILLTPKRPTPFIITPYKVVKIDFSYNPVQFAYYDANTTVVIFSYNCESSEWTFSGKLRGHSKEIRDIMFMPAIPLSKLYTISEDRHLVEYNNGQVPQEPFYIKSRQRIEQADIPISFTYWLEKNQVDYIILSDDQHKLKILYPTSKVPKMIVAGPAFGCFRNQMILKMQVVPGHESRYMIFSTTKYLGIHILPPDGSPYKYVGHLAHPSKLQDFQLSHDGQYVFTFGTRDHCILKWEIKLKAVNIMNILGGKELSPFYSLLEGGRNGWLFHEIKDLFYYMQILQQENIDLPRRVSDTLALTDIPDLVRTCGFYPSDFQLENMLIDIRYRNFDDNMKVNEDINFFDFIKLLINHRPAYGYTLDQIKEAFEFLQVSADPYCNEGIRRDEFIKIFVHDGEPVSSFNIFKCFRTLMRRTDTEENFDFLPDVITFRFFCDEVLGIDMSRDKIKEFDNVSENSIIKEDDETSTSDKNR